MAARHFLNASTKHKIIWYSAAEKSPGWQLSSANPNTFPDKNSQPSRNHTTGSKTIVKKIENN
jgi:hypothetical protein